MKRIIVSDSSSCVLSREDVPFKNVPLKIITDEREFVDVAGMDVTEMVTYLRGYKGRSTTSCPNVQDWLDAFGDADEVFGMTITHTLSGSYEMAMQAKKQYEEIHPGAQVYIHDSLSCGPGMSMVVDKMAELIKADVPFEQIVRETQVYSRRNHLLFTLNHVDNLARNGRVHPAAAAIAGVLGIRMIGKASDKGELQLIHKVRGEQKCVKITYMEMKKHGYAGTLVRITHCLNPEMAQLLADTVHSEFPNAPVEIGPCSGLCSFYAEEGGMIIGYDGAEKSLS